MTKKYISISIASFALMLLGFTIVMTTSNQVSIYPHFWDGAATQAGFGIFLLTLGTRLFLSIPDAVHTAESSLRKLKMLSDLGVIFGDCTMLYGVSNTLGIFGS